MVIADYTKTYKFSRDDALIYGKEVPRHICDRCKQEILGDCQIDIIDTDKDEADNYM